jgi:YihY family inner membrane protein
MDPAALIDRVLDEPRVAYVRAVLDVYGRAPGGLLANGLAFAALFAAFPIAFVLLGVAGWIVGDPAAQERLAEAISELVPPLAEVIDQALVALSNGAVATSIIGVIGLIWTVSQFYVTLDVALSRIFTGRSERDVVRRTARGFAWVAMLVGLVIVLIVGGALAALATTLLPERRDALGIAADVIGSLPALIAIGIAVVALVYRFVPPSAPSWTAIRLPAIVAGAGIILLSQLFLFLAPRLVGIAAVAGSLATAFVALAWLSFTFQGLLYGAAWVRVRDDRARAGTSALAGAAAPTEPGGGGE